MPTSFHVEQSCRLDTPKAPPHPCDGAQWGIPRDGPFRWTLAPARRKPKQGSTTAVKGQVGARQPRAGRPSSSWSAMPPELGCERGVESRLTRTQRRPRHGPPAMNIGIPVQCDPHVRDRFSRAGKTDEITFAHAFQPRQWPRGPALLAGVARQSQPLLGKHELHERRAIQARGGAAPPEVGHPQQVCNPLPQDERMRPGSIPRHRIPGKPGRSPIGK